MRFKFPFAAAFRLAWAAACFSAALLAVFPAPTYKLWMLALGVTEWGHILAALSLLCWLPGWRASACGRLGAALGLGAFFLAWTPLARSVSVASGLPKSLERAFGSAGSRIGAPLSLSRALLGASFGPTRFQTRAFSRRDGQELRMDIYSPAQAHSASPCVISIHGGSWSGGNREDFSWMSRALASLGYVAVSIDYRLAPEAPFPAAVEDVREAIAYVKRNAGELRIDPNRLALIGRSAGGQIALMAAYERPDPAVRGVVAFYAPTDLVYAYLRPVNPRVLDTWTVLRTYLGGEPKARRGLYERASPVNFVGPKTPPTLLIHGLRDEFVWDAHSELLERRLRARGRRGLYVRLPWATHGCDYNPSGPCGQLSRYAVENFLAAVFR